METIEKKKALFVFQLILMVPLAGMGTTLFVPSLPSIAAQLGSSDTLVKLTITYYLIGYAVGTPIFGTLSDTYGRKNPLVIGLILFVVASYCITLAHDIHTVLLLRLAQGISVAAPGAISKAISTDLFSGKKFAKISSTLTTIRALGPIVAPVVGGYLEVLYGWQASFYFFVAYGLLVLICVLFWLKETHFKRLSLHLPTVLKTYGIALSHRNFLGALLCMALVYAMMVIFNVMGPFLVETIMGFSAITYGHMALFVGSGFFLGSLGNRFLIHHFSITSVLLYSVCGGFLIACAMLLGAFLLGMNIFVLIFGSFLLLFAGGLIFPNSMTRSLSIFPHFSGTASALMGTFSIGSVIVSLIASSLTTTSLIPISTFFTILMGVCLFIYFLMVHKEHHHHPE